MRVVAVRYTSDVAMLAACYEALGLSRRTTAHAGGFVDLTAGARGGHATTQSERDKWEWPLAPGAQRRVVIVHAAGSSQNHVPAGGGDLSFETDDLDATADSLADLQPVRWDESYGQHLAVRDPRGDGIWINAAMTDFYGYERHDPRPNDMELIAIRFSDDFATDAAFYTALGFDVRAGSNEHWTSLASAGGVIGLHPPAQAVPVGPFSSENPVAPPALVTVSFETHEALEQLHDRLQAEGISATLALDGPAPRLSVVDPDGVEIEIHVAR